MLTNEQDQSDLKGQADPVSLARNIILRHLNLAPKSRLQLTQVLDKKGIPAQAAQIALDRLTEVGLIDDLAYAHLLVRSRCASKRISKILLIRELRQKGISEEYISISLADLTPDDEYQMALDLAAKKLRTMSGLPKEVVLRRVVGLLARKGYPNAIAYKVLKNLELDTQDLTRGDYYLG